MSPYCFRTEHYHYDERDTRIVSLVIERLAKNPHDQREEFYANGMPSTLPRTKGCV